MLPAGADTTVFPDVCPERKVALNASTSNRIQTPLTQSRILVADSLSDKGLALMREAGLQVDVKTGLSEDELVGIVGEYDGLIVRSSTNVTRRIVEAAKRMQVMGRAGVGVDNIDVEAATKAGIVVQNTPLGNITSAAEHAIALLFAVARNIPRADQEMHAGKWNKKGLTGVELTGKNLGVVGFGKVGGIVARTAQSLSMNVMVFDPYVTERKAEELNVVKVELEALLEQADFISVHAPLTPQTENLLGLAQFEKMKPTARLVNAARGGIVNEAALAEALAKGRIAAAALDVFTQEPLAADSPLRGAPNLILTPHLGASTAEAQERVAEDIARQFVEYFRDGAVRNAVNLSVSLDPKTLAYGRLAELLGSMAAQMAPAAVRTVKVGSYGKLAQLQTKPLSLCALKGLLGNTSTDPVTLVNAPVIAEARGIELVEHQSAKASTYASLLVVAVETEKGEITLAGTCFDDREARIVRVGDFDLDLKPSQHLLLMFYEDRPGMVGKFGTILGEADINIANMAVGRREKRGQAVVALTLDDPVPQEVLGRLRQAARIDELYTLRLKV